MNYLKENIKYLRNNQSYRELAKRIGINHVTIYRIETGLKENPSLLDIIKIASFFDIKIDDLISKDITAHN